MKPIGNLVGEFSIDERCEGACSYGSQRNVAGTRCGHAQGGAARGRLRDACQHGRRCGTGRRRARRSSPPDSGPDGPSRRVGAASTGSQHPGTNGPTWRDRSDGVAVGAPAVGVGRAEPEPGWIQHRRIGAPTLRRRYPCPPAGKRHDVVEHRGPDAVRNRGPAAAVNRSTDAARNRRSDADAPCRRRQRRSSADGHRRIRG